MKSQLDRMENKIDKQSDDIAKINSTLAAQHVSLEDHIRRTEILEREIKPLKTRHERVNGVLKLVGLVATIGGVIEAMVLVLEHLGK